MMPSAARRSYASTTVDGETPMVSAKRRTDGTRSPGPSARLVVLVRMALISASVRVICASPTIAAPFNRMDHLTHTVSSNCTSPFLVVPALSGYCDALSDVRPHGTDKRGLGQRPLGRDHLQRIAAGDP